MSKVTFLMEYWSTNSKYVLFKITHDQFLFPEKNDAVDSLIEIGTTLALRGCHSPRTKMINGIYKSLFEDATSWLTCGARRMSSELPKCRRPRAAFWPTTSAIPSRPPPGQLWTDFAPNPRKNCACNGRSRHLKRHQRPFWRCVRLKNYLRTLSYFNH